MAKGGQLDLLQLDNASLTTVRECAVDFLSRSHRLHVLIGNAGIMATPEERTEDGFELAVNHLAHALLMERLRWGSIQLDDLHFNKKEYDPLKAYAQSHGIDRRYSADCPLGAARLRPEHRCCHTCPTRIHTPSSK